MGYNRYWQCGDLLHPSGPVMRQWARMLMGHMCYRRSKDKSG